MSCLVANCKARFRKLADSHRGADQQYQRDAKTAEAVLDHPVYSRLPLQTENSIRLLRIQKSDAQIVICWIDVVDLANPPVFHALSYCWGAYSDEARRNGVTDARIFPISCNDEALFVTQNLHDFLVGMQQTDLLEASDCIWIDAICISQHDDHERGSQVSLMGNIYESATRIIVWLGREDMDTSSALELFNLTFSQSSPVALFTFPPWSYTDHF